MAYLFFWAGLRETKRKPKSIRWGLNPCSTHTHTHTYMLFVQMRLERGSKCWFQFLSGWQMNAKQCCHNINRRLRLRVFPSLPVFPLLLSFKRKHEKPITDVLPMRVGHLFTQRSQKSTHLTQGPGNKVTLSRRIQSSAQNWLES